MRRKATFATIGSVYKFQFTHPGGVRPARRSSPIRATAEFQFTHPGGVRRSPRKRGGLIGRFQFTHPGGVRRVALPCSRADISVSIHAPGRGATISISRLIAIHSFQFTHPGGVRQLLSAGVSRSQTVSIHAPGRGATNVSRAPRLQNRRFNSRTREGCDTSGGHS